MKKLRKESLEDLPSYFVFNQGMTVIPHPKHYNYNVKVRWIAFTLENYRWTIKHTYSDYFLRKVDYKEDQLKQMFNTDRVMEHGVALQDLVLVNILIPCTQEALRLYDTDGYIPTF